MMPMRERGGSGAGVAGAGDVELMYQAWVNSGLAAQGSPIFLTLWSEDDVALHCQVELLICVRGCISHSQSSI